MEKETFYSIFRQLNNTPRPSHHEEKAADFLCNFAKEHGLRYRRDGQNNVVIEKDATPGYEDAVPVVILNHMDMVCVAKDGYLRDGHTFDPENDVIKAYIEEEKQADGTTRRWMKAEGTSLGADNGMGLSMGLAVLANNDIIHGPIEVLTTTNEEDGMSGAEALSLDFIKGRKIINLDSEAYDEITVGAAGAYLQIAEWDITKADVPAGCLFRNITIDGGLGGHSGVDINKGRCHTNKALAQFIISQDYLMVCKIDGGTANASISSRSNAVVAVKPEDLTRLEQAVVTLNNQLNKEYAATDAGIKASIADAAEQKQYIANASELANCVDKLPCGMIAMRPDMPGTVKTSNNIGRITTGDNLMTVSCHSRSFDDEEMRALGRNIAEIAKANGAREVKLMMDTPAWVERPDSPLLALTCKTFDDVLGFEPKKVAMHFVLEAAYYVQKYPGVEIASIGPLIIEPHSTSERIDLDTADNIWKVTVELLRRLANEKA